LLYILFIKHPNKSQNYSKSLTKLNFDPLIAQSLNVIITEAQLLDVLCLDWEVIVVTASQSFFIK